MAVVFSLVFSSASASTSSSSSSSSLRETAEREQTVILLMEDDKNDDSMKTPVRAELPLAITKTTTSEWNGIESGEMAERPPGSLPGNTAPIVSVAAATTRNSIGSEPERHRRAQELSCSAAWMNCWNNTACSKCFQAIDQYLIFTIAQRTPCEVVLDALHNKNLCMDVASSANAGSSSQSTNKDTFCTLVESCNDQSSTSNRIVSNTTTSVDWDVYCASLTECAWNGMNPNYFGDGVCHDRKNGWDGCYNTPICKYDGGDCCYESCNSTTGRNNGVDEIIYFTCGRRGETEFHCRDPKYESTAISGGGSQSSTTYKVPMECTAGTTLYRINMFDSFGDGWDDTYLEIRMQDSNKTLLFKDQLMSGSSGTSYVCLSSSLPTCYDVSIEGGMWGREITWEIRGGLYIGSPTIAYGDSPMLCQFGVAGISSSTCPTTCTGGGGSGGGKGSAEYKTLKDMTPCINDQCFIQVATCQYDAVCRNCFQDNPPDSCFSSDSFNALSDCTLCKCTDANKTEFCSTKAVRSSTSTSAAIDAACSSMELSTGGSAIFDFVNCSGVDVQYFTKDYVFDNEQFGELDKFEACATAFANEKSSNSSKKDDIGRTALGCMQILVSAMSVHEKSANDSDQYYPGLVSYLASNLYHSGPQFCDCSIKAYDNTPSCTGFVNYKTLLYEAVDACKALDSIDCAAWAEFAQPCRNNIIAEYERVDFQNNKDECSYVQHMACGGAGAFPAFRRIDCEAEVDAKAWSLYNDYVTYCDMDFADYGYEKQHQQQQQQQQQQQPAPTPTVPTTLSPTANSPPVVVTAAPQQKKTPYKPPEELPGTVKKKSHWFRNFILISIVGYVGYYLYNRRHEFSSYQRLHPNYSFDNSGYNFTSLNQHGGGGGGFGGGMTFPTFGGGGGGGGTMGMGLGSDDMYTGLSLESSMLGGSTANFESTTLPPSMLSSSTFMGMGMGGGSSNASSGPTFQSSGSGNYAI